jgi:hypothetical protein
MPAPTKFDPPTQISRMLEQLHPANSQASVDDIAHAVARAVAAEVPGGTVTARIEGLNDLRLTLLDRDGCLAVVSAACAERLRATTAGFLGVKLLLKPRCATVAVPC